MNLLYSLFFPCIIKTKKYNNNNYYEICGNSKLKFIFYLLSNIILFKHYLNINK